MAIPAAAEIICFRGKLTRRGDIQHYVSCQGRTGEQIAQSRISARQRRVDGHGHSVGVLTRSQGGSEGRACGDSGLTDQRVIGDVGGHQLRLAQQAVEGTETGGGRRESEEGPARGTESEGR